MLQAGVVLEALDTRLEEVGLMVPLDLGAKVIHLHLHLQLQLHLLLHLHLHLHPRAVAT